MSPRVSRRDQVGQMLGANPLLGVWLITLVLAVFAFGWQRLHAQEPDEDLLMKCPAACRQIEYGSAAWYWQCYPLPRRCSANPDEELTLAQRVLLLLINAQVIR